MKRVLVFIDAQNFYRNARRAFFTPADSYVSGQYQPWKVGAALASRDPGRRLVGVRLYTGRPDASLQPKAHGANVRQCLAWERWGCNVFHRPLRYPAGWPQVGEGARPSEKGVDVLMALHVVRAARSKECDVVVLCTGDTDLLPAVDEIFDLANGVTVEVAGWRSPRYRQRLSHPDRNLWCHWLERADYDRTCDPVDYTR